MLKIYDETTIISAMENVSGEEARIYVASVGGPFVGFEEWAGLESKKVFQTLDAAEYYYYQRGYRF